MLPGVLFPLPLAACCSMLVFLLWPAREGGAEVMFLFGWPVLGWHPGEAANPFSGSQNVCSHVYSGKNCGLKQIETLLRTS